MPSDTATQLRELFGSHQLGQLDVVRARLLEDPKALDTHSREVRSPGTEVANGTGS